MGRRKTKNEKTNVNEIEDKSKENREGGVVKSGSGIEIKSKLGIETGPRSTIITIPKTKTKTGNGIGIGITKMPSHQQVLNFDGRKPKFEIPSGLVESFNVHMRLNIPKGIKEVRWREGNRGFDLIAVNETFSRIARGVTRTIDRVFGNDDVNEILNLKRAKGRFDAAATSSKAMGTLIHAHITHLVECKDVCKCNRLRLIASKDKTNKYARAAIRVLEERRYYPLRSEVAIYSPEMDIATQVDLICLTDELKYVLISIKTGYSRYMNESEKFFFKHPIDDVYDTQKNRHQLQVLIEKMILERTYHITIAKTEVMYIRSDSDAIDMISFLNSAKLHFPDDIEDRIWSGLTEIVPMTEEMFVPNPDFLILESEPEMETETEKEPNVEKTQAKSKKRKHNRASGKETESDVVLPCKKKRKESEAIVEKEKEKEPEPEPEPMREQEARSEPDDKGKKSPYFSFSNYITGSRPVAMVIPVKKNESMRTTSLLNSGSASIGGPSEVSLDMMQTQGL